MHNQTLTIVDTTNLLYQLWYSTDKNQLNQQGEPINVLNAFQLFCQQLKKNEQPSCLIFVFDQRLKTSIRKQLYPDYKNQRSKTPEDLERQFAWCQTWLKEHEYSQISSSKVEADDVIASLVHYYRKGFDQIMIISSDKDLFQLIAANDVWWNIQKDEKLREKDIIKLTGVKPEQIADQLALAGDKSDNIQGIPGIGLTTAAKLLRKFDDLETVIEQRHTVKEMKFRNAYYVYSQLNQYYQRLDINKQLTRLKIDTTEIEALNLCHN